MKPPDTPLAELLRDRYAFEKELGRGGMATVYLARDLKHDRPVALKVMHPELAATLGPETSASPGFRPARPTSVPAASGALTTATGTGATGVQLDRLEARARGGGGPFSGATGPATHARAATTGAGRGVP